MTLPEKLLTLRKRSGYSQEYVAEQVRSKFGVKNIQINFVGPVIGAHSGPGTVALFFFGTQR